MPANGNGQAEAGRAAAGAQIELSPGAIEAIDHLFERLILRLPNAAPVPGRGEVIPPGPMQCSILTAINNFDRKRLTYDLGKGTYQQFMMLFDLAMHSAGFSSPQEGNGYEGMDHREIEMQNTLKGLLYACMTGEALRLAGRRSWPKNEEMINLNFNQYSNKLRLLFEPPSESESSRHEFRARLQQRGENPLMYCSDKVQLYERAWPTAQRDMVTMLDEITAGLLNESLRKEMRRSKARNEVDYDHDLRFAVNSLRKQLLAGELPEEEGEGLELQSSTMSYIAAQKSAQAAFVKAEPGVFAFNNRNTAKVKRCYHCQQQGHFVANCPRKASGLPAASALEADDAGDDGHENAQLGNEPQVDDEGDDEISVFRGKKRFPGRPKRFQNKRVRFDIPEQKWKKTGNKQRLGTLYRVGNNIQLIESESSTEDEMDESTSSPEQVHTVVSENTEYESLEGSDFLGM